MTRNRGQNQKGAGASRSGLTLLELMITVTVSSIVFIGLTQVILASIHASSQHHEDAVARAGARQLIEELQAADFLTAFALYNSDPADDPGGAGTAPGADFPVVGLEPAEGDPDGLVGEILFPVEAAAPGVLREDIPSVPLGMPRDLNGDGNTDALDHAGDYRVLPVLVRVTWRGTRGTSQLEIKTLLSNLL